MRRRPQHSWVPVDGPFSDGETFTLPLEIDALYMSGTDTSITAAFAVSSILVLIAVVVLILRNIFEYRNKKTHTPR